MGICSSCESTPVATAKVIMHDGRLQEFSYPVKASYVLQQYPTFFICNSDEMDFDDVLSAVSDDEVLQPGQLYFALPLSRLRRRLQAEDMAALAVKASSALAKCGGGGGEKCGCSRKNLLFAVEKQTAKVGDSGGVEDIVVRRGRSGGGSGRRGKFTAELSTIPE